ncbi:MAG: hypothetical protein ABIN20_00970 [candidate division WOR-3 bacterium]
MFKKFIFLFFIFFLYCKGKEGALNTNIFPENENLIYVVKTVQGDSLGVLNVSIKKEKNFINFKQDLPNSEVKMDLKTLKPVSSILRIFLPQGPVEISSEFKKGEILLKARFPGGIKDTVLKTKENFYHSDFLIMIPRALPFESGKIYEVKSFVPLRAQIFDVKINIVGLEEVSFKDSKFRGYHVIFDFGVEKHDAYYEEKSPHRLLYYTNGRNSIALKI